jgi:predicted ATP-grasp superfamily ATP-dependent carboligase
MVHATPPVLLGSAAYGGTIAAARNLGKEGIEVRIISTPRTLGAAAWSRFVGRTYRAPSESDETRFLERLLAIGVADPGQVLLATSDETAWLYTVNAELLRKNFRLHLPSIEVLNRVLDKALLASAAVAAGLPTLPIWDPRGVEDLLDLAPGLPYPVLIKPRTHVHRHRHNKGVVVKSPKDLISQYRKFVACEKAANAGTADLSEPGLPILQQFAGPGDKGILSVTGFIDESGELFVTRQARKVFQRSEPLGVGVCFESLPDDPMLSEAARTLCRAIGYFGIFEIEFVWFGDRWNIIDFNPRLFNQIGMDVGRGMPLPLFAYLDAVGEKERLREVVPKARAADQVKLYLCDRFTMSAILLAKSAIARIAGDDRAYWRAWIRENKSCLMDVAIDETDPMPGIVHALSETFLGLKAVPFFLRNNQ